MYGRNFFAMSCEKEVPAISANNRRDCTQNNTGIANVPIYSIIQNCSCRTDTAASAAMITICVTSKEWLTDATAKVKPKATRPKIRRTKIAEQKTVIPGASIRIDIAREW